jgi:YfiH family protein
MLQIEYADLPIPTVTAGVVLRSQRTGNPGGVSLWASGGYAPREVDLTRRVLATTLRRPLSAFRMLRQVHGDTVLYRSASEEVAGNVDPPRGDAHWTREPGVVLLANVADCCPVVVAHRSGRFVGLAHSGWRGTAAKIAQNLIRTICSDRETSCNPRELYLWIGPCAEAERYEIGSDTAVHFAQYPDALRPHPGQRDKYLLDVAGTIRRQAIAAGVPEEQISVNAGGTIGDARYHSHRRDGYHAGRMAAFVTFDGVV